MALSELQKIKTNKKIITFGFYWAPEQSINILFSCRARPVEPDLFLLGSAQVFSKIAYRYTSLRFRFSEVQVQFIWSSVSNWHLSLDFFEFMPETPLHRQNSNQRLSSIKTYSSEFWLGFDEYNFIGYRFDIPACNHRWINNPLTKSEDRSNTCTISHLKGPTLEDRVRRSNSYSRTRLKNSNTEL